MKNILKKYLIERLLKKGFDLNDKNLFKKKGYDKFKFEYLLVGDEGSCSIDYYIEKYLLSQEQINQMKEGLFDINVDKESLIPKITAISLYNEIEDELCDKEKSENFSVENIRQKIEGKHGLNLQLKNKFDFNFDHFEDSEYQKLKLKKLIYNMHEKNKKLYDLLQNPSTENIDNNIINENTVYGKTIAILKNEVMKESGKIFIGDTKKSIFNITACWTNIISNVTLKLFLKDKKLIDMELNRINLFLEKFVNKIPNTKNLKIPNKHSIFETFYLKLLQHEQLGLGKDLEKINNYDKKISIEPIYLQRYQKIKSEVVQIDDIKNYIIKNLNQITQLVYMSEFAEEDDKKVIKKKSTIELLVNFLKIWRNEKLYLEKEVPLLLIISALQEIIYSKETKETYPIKYYSYEKEHLTLISKIKQGMDSRIGYKLLWMKKVNQRLFSNLDLKTEYSKAISIEKNIDKIISFIMFYPNLADMSFIHNEFFKIVRRSILSDYIFQKDIHYMGKSIYDKTGFKLTILHDNIYNYYKEIISSTIQDDVLKFLIKTIKKIKKENKNEEAKKQRGFYSTTTSMKDKIEIEIFDENQNANNFILLYSINFNRKEISLENFYTVYSNNSVTQLLSLGLDNFVLIG